MIYKERAIGNYVKSSFGKYIKDGKGINRVIKGGKGLGALGLATGIAIGAIGKASGDFTRANDKYRNQTVKQADDLIRVIKSRRKTK